MGDRIGVKCAVHSRTKRRAPTSAPHPSTLTASGFTARAVLAALAASLAVRVWLSRRQVAHVLAHRDAVPAAFASSIGLAAHQKAADYTVAKQRLGTLNTLVDAALLLLMTLGGGLAVDRRLDRDDRRVAAVARRAAVRRDRHHLRRRQPAVFVVADLPHRGALRLQPDVAGASGSPTSPRASRWPSSLGLPLLVLVLWLMRTAGALWWLWAWGAWMAFQLLILVLYPTRDRAAVQQVHAAWRRPGARAHRGAAGALRLCARRAVRDGRVEALRPRQRVFHRLRPRQAHRVLRHAARRGSSPTRSKPCWRTNSGTTS